MKKQVVSTSEALVIEALKRLQAARVTLLLHEPFYGALAHQLKPKPDWSCSAAWVDGRSLGFNPKYVCSLTNDQLVAVYQHEIEHCALGHPWRREGRDPETWNIATDKIINSNLRTAGRKLPDGLYYAEGEELGKSAEWVYAREQQRQAEEAAQQAAEAAAEEAEEEQESEPEENDGQEGGGDGDEADDNQDEGEEEGDGDGQGDGDGNGESEQDGDGNGDSEGEGDAEGDGDGQGDGEGQGEGDGEQEGGKGGQGEGLQDGDGTGDGSGESGDDFNPFGEVRDAPTDEDEQGDPPPTEQEWKEKVMVAMQTAKAQGNMPAGLERAIQDAIRPRLDPRALLLRFFSEQTASDYTWTQPSRRYLTHGLYLPALAEKTLGKVAIWVDTSGSMDETSLGISRGLVESVIEECKPAAVDIYYADAAVCGHDHFEQGEPLEWRPKGGGGTDFRPVFKAILEQDELPTCIIGITDLEGTFPEREPEVPSIWLVTPCPWAWAESNKQAPWGETVNLEV